MSQPEGAAPAAPQTESRSSIEITRNAKGDAQIRVKVYAGEDAKDLDDLETQAKALYDSLANAYPVPAAAK